MPWRLLRRAWGLSGRLTASYVVVTLAVIVLVEGLVLGYQAPGLVNDAQLEAQVGATAKTFLGQLVRTYPRGDLPEGALLGERGQPPRFGHVRVRADGATLVVPAVSGPLPRSRSLTAVVAIAADGRVVASSAPSRYRPGQPLARALPAPAVRAFLRGRAQGAGATGTASTPAGTVAWALTGLPGPGLKAPPHQSGLVAYVYVGAPEQTGFVGPVQAWDELRQLSAASPLLWASYALLVAIVPVGVLFGLLASRRLVRRLRRLERAAVAIAEGDYSVTLPVFGRDEVGRLEANFTTMARQLGSALASERERAGADARAGERARLAREVHDAISQHLFGLRMIAAGMRKADPANEQAKAVERITADALRDMQALLLELRPARFDGAGLAPALEEVCAAYHDRLGVTVDVQLDNVSVPGPVGHALVRIAQEACTNAVRHGHAQQLTVRMARRSGHVELAVGDAGTGFDPAAPHSGTGLQHIRDRVVELGGTLDIDSAPGRGTSLTVRVPVP